MNSVVLTAIVSTLLFLGTLALLVTLFSEWIDERRRRKTSEAAAERLRQRVREVRAEADAAKDALTRCETAAAEAAAAARKAGDSVTLANEIIAGARNATRD